MELTAEQIGVVLGIAYLLAEVLKWGAKSLYALATGKKDQISKMEEMLSKATNNHLSHLQSGTEEMVKLMSHSISQHEQMIRQGEQQISTHEKQIELLGVISGKLSK